MYRLSTRMNGITTSAIREIFKVLGKPGMISLAGGSPDPATFPLELIPRLTDQVISEYGPAILQYGITEGFIPLREALSEYLKNEKRVEVKGANIFISTGAQSAIDSFAKIMLDKGDKIAIESPTFLGSIKTFKCYEPEFVSVPTDEHGIIPEELENILKTHKIKFLYTIPNFQNPTGTTLTIERRQRIAEVAKEFDLLILEDDPYFELRYIGEHLPSIYSMAPANVVYVGSLSKILSPGMRIGYYFGPEQIVSQMVSVKQGVDVHTPTLTQAIAAKYISDGHLSNQVPKIISIYKPKLEKMLATLEKTFPKEFSWTKPDGGMFVWVKGPDHFVAKDVYPKAIENNVAFVPGQFFFENETMGLNTFRLNFTNVSVENIEKGINVLSNILVNKK